jgi:hypothetical protein
VTRGINPVNYFNFMYLPCQCTCRSHQRFPAIIHLCGHSDFSSFPTGPFRPVEYIRPQIVAGHLTVGKILGTTNGFQAAGMTPCTVGPGSNRHLGDFVQVRETPALQTPLSAWESVEIGFQIHRAHKSPQGKSFFEDTYRILLCQQGSQIVSFFGVDT